MLDETRKRQRRLVSWFDTPLGRSLQAVEANSLRHVLPPLYGTTAIQLGKLGQHDLMDSCVAPCRITLDLLTTSNGALVRGEPEALPFDTRSVDVAVLPHTLDFCDDPHQVLREVNRVLAPEGHVVILGFNPFSMWGLRRLFTLDRRAPWFGRFLPLSRIKDWFALLEFEFVQGKMLYYRPPVQRDGIRDRLGFLDPAGDRWWPLTAAVYLVIAKRRVAGVTPLPLKWKDKKAINTAAAAAPARYSAVRRQRMRANHLRIVTRRG